MVELEIQMKCAHLYGSWNCPLIPLTRSNIVVIEKHTGKKVEVWVRKGKSPGRTVFWDEEPMNHVIKDVNCNERMASREASLPGCPSCFFETAMLRPRMWDEK